MALYGKQGIAGAWDPLKPNWTWGSGKDVERIRDVNQNLDKLIRKMSVAPSSVPMKGGGRFTPMRARETINVLHWKDGHISVQNTNTWQC